MNSHTSPAATASDVSEAVQPPALASPAVLLPRPSSSAAIRAAKRNGYEEQAAMVLPVKAVHQPVQGLGEQVMDPNGSFKDRDACMEYGAAALERGDCAGAEKAFLEALAFAPKDAAVMNALGMVSQRKRDFDSAIRWHRAAIAQQPGNDEMYYNLGDIYLERGDMETAMLYQKKAIQLNPGFQRRTRVYN